MTLSLQHVKVEKSAAMGGKPHRYVDVAVKEISLVTEPAILTEGEDGSVGLPVVKMAARKVPDGITKNLNLGPDDDAIKVLDELSEEGQRIVMREFPNDEAAWWSYLIKVVGSEAIFADRWMSAFDDEFYVYSLPFDRVNGTFTFGDITKMKVQFVPVEEAADTEKNESSAGGDKSSEEPSEESTMKIFKVETPAFKLNWPAVKGSELLDGDGVLICKCETDGEIITGDSYTCANDVVSQTTKDEPVVADENPADEPADEQPEAKVEVEVTEPVADVAKNEEPDEAAEPSAVLKTLSMADLKTLMSQSGKSCTLKIATDGSFELNTVVDAGTPVAAISKNEPAAEVEAKKTSGQLEAENRRLTQELSTKSIVTGGQTYEVEALKGANSGLGNATAGLFTQHLHGTNSLRGING